MDAVMIGYLSSWPGVQAEARMVARALKSTLDEFRKDLGRACLVAIAGSGHLFVRSRAKAVEGRAQRRAGVAERFKARMQRAKTGRHGSIPYSVPR